MKLHSVHFHVATVLRLIRVGRVQTPILRRSAPAATQRATTTAFRSTRRCVRSVAIVEKWLRLRSPWVLCVVSPLESRLVTIIVTKIMAGKAAEDVGGQHSLAGGDGSGCGRQRALVATQRRE
jgi:hypothetical protein